MNRHRSKRSPDPPCRFRKFLDNAVVVVRLLAYILAIGIALYPFVMEGKLPGSTFKISGTNTTTTNKQNGAIGAAIIEELYARKQNSFCNTDAKRRKSYKFDILNIMQVNNIVSFTPTGVVPPKAETMSLELINNNFNNLHIENFSLPRAA